MKFQIAFEIHINFPAGECRTEPRVTEYGLGGLRSEFSCHEVLFTSKCFVPHSNPQPVAFRGHFC